jgi:hypothetical protein
VADFGQYGRRSAPLRTRSIAKEEADAFGQFAGTSSMARLTSAKDDLALLRGARQFVLMCRRSHRIRHDGADVAAAEELRWRLDCSGGRQHAGDDLRRALLMRQVSAAGLANVYGTTVPDGGESPPSHLLGAGPPISPEQGPPRGELSANRHGSAQWIQGLVDVPRRPSAKTGTARLDRRAVPGTVADLANANPVGMAGDGRIMLGHAGCEPAGHGRAQGSGTHTVRM